jgi:poly(3-hydroxybutyrate) depolymerase
MPVYLSQTAHGVKDCGASGRVLCCGAANQGGMTMLFSDSRSLYEAFDSWSAAMRPFSAAAGEIANLLNDHRNAPYLPDLWRAAPGFLAARRAASAWWYLAAIFTRAYDKPAWAITRTEVNGKPCGVAVETVAEKPFCTLIRFAKTVEVKQPKMLVVAPMSGHYATLVRDTVESLLPHYDVYVTDWVNARDVPLSEGGFDLDAFVDYLISFSHKLAPNLHVMAICQPVVPLFMATCLMSSARDTRAPASCVLIGGPLDTAQSPTGVNTLAMDNPIDRFQRNVIALVPPRYPGAMRLVYPGFMQLAGFMSMNPDKHAQSLRNAVQNFIEGDFAGARKTVMFYLEYFSVMDLTAEFYLQTINSIFKENRLAQGRLLSRGRPVDPKAVESIALLAIEGEKDDICGRGQTKAALALCANLPADKKRYHLQKDVGHYGQFSGSKFRKYVLPVIQEFTAAQGKARAAARAPKAVA